MTLFWKSWILAFWPLGPGGVSAGKIFATIKLHFVIPFNWYATWPCSEKVEFWSPGLGRGICKQNICNQCMALVIPFNLICYMAMFRKSWILSFWPWGNFRPQGDNLNNLGRCPLGEATYQISRLYALCFQTRRFFMFFLCISLCRTCDPWGQASIGPRGVIWTNLVEVH